MTELNKYKKVIEEEKPAEVMWFNSSEFQDKVAERFHRIEKEMGGFDESSSSVAGQDSRVDILEKNLHKMQEFLDSFNVDEDLEEVRKEILEIHNRDLKDSEKEFNKKLAELAKEAKELAKRLDLNQVWKAPHFLKVLERVANLEKRPIAGGGGGGG